jgi:hypothetical protein
MKNDELVRIKLVTLSQDSDEMLHQLESLLYLAAAAVNRQPHLVTENSEEPGLW